MQVIISSCYSKKVVVQISPSENILGLKQAIYKKMQIPPDFQKLYYRSKPLQDDQQIEEVGLQQNSMLDLNMPVRGGIQMLKSLRFNGLANQIEKKFQPIHLSYRNIHHGLNLIGKCLNQQCKAYEDYVCSPQNFGSFNMHKVCQLTKCVECEQFLSMVDNCVFFMCEFQSEGMLKGKQITNSVQTHDNESTYITYTSESEADIVEWDYLEIHVKQLQKRE